MSLNRATIAGRLTRDPELRRTQNGTAVANFSLAVDRDFKDQSTGERAADFIDVVAWRQTAEFVSRYVTKGRMAVVDGRIQTRTWKDKDGKDRKGVEVVAERVYFGDSKREDTGRNDGGRGGYPGGYSSPSPYADSYPAQPDPDSEFSELTTDDGDFPF